MFRRAKFRVYVTEAEVEVYVELISRESTVLEDRFPDDRTRSPPTLMTVSWSNLHEPPPSTPS